jgi:3-oxoacyl-[acyl-carrier protein] reductase
MPCVEPMTRRLDGQVAIVTGASRGIGRATALLLARLGAAVVANFHRAEGAAATLANELGTRGVLVRGDVADPATAEALKQAAIGRFGRIDILVNNAGVSPYQPIAGHPDEAWHHTIGINLTGPFFCARAVAQPMVAQGSGRIINVASQMALIGAEGYSAYCASKGGLIAFTKALARELAPAGVLVNCVAPGPVETDMLMTGSPEYNEETRLALPVRRWGRPDEIAETVVFLCGAGGAFYAGQVLGPNGGSVM